MSKKNKRKSNKSKSSRPSRRRTASKQGNQLNFHQLEDRHLLAAITVTNATDLTNADTSSIAALIADDGGDGISLREAITATNNSAGEDTITFDGSVFTGGVSSLIRLTQGELDITESLTIDASMATDVTITGDAASDDATVPGTFITDVAASFGVAVGATDDLLDDNSRVINFSAGDLTLSHLTLTGGRTGSYNSGAGIVAFGDSLTLLSSTVSGNSTNGTNGGLGPAAGGGIAAFEGELSLTDSLVSNNSTTGRLSDGGGIFFDGSNLSLSNTVVSGNSTDGSRSRGGGVFASSANVVLTDSSVTDNNTIGSSSDGGGVAAPDGNVSLSNSNISGNGTSGDNSPGGGVAAESVTLTNSDVSDNSTSGRLSDGAGISVLGLLGDSSLTDSTVSGNNATGMSVDGGGIRVQYGNLSLINSTVTDNSASGIGSDGGGIWTNGNLTLTSSGVSGNRSYIGGGGIRAIGGFETQPVYLTDSVVNDNSTSGNFARGGGIFANTDVVLVGSTVSGNSTIGADSPGGGISVQGASLSLTDSTVSENSTFGNASYGGGIQNSGGTLSLVDSTISDNGTTGDSSSGGGISASTAMLTGSTINGNSSTGPLSDGGGISVFTFMLTNSTISGNNTTGDGGGVVTTGEFSSTSSTITDNVAGDEGGGVAVVLNGISEFRSINSIIAGNMDGGVAPDISNFFVFSSVEQSLIGDTEGSGITASLESGNILDQPALLGPLVDNGGPTFTHAPLLSSPAINAGSNVLALDADGLQLINDQRGAPFSRISGDAVDIGAFEVQLQSPTVVSATINEGGVLARPDLWNTLTVVFDSEVNVAADDLSLFNISTLGSSVDLSGVGFDFDSSTNTATWNFGTLAAPLDAAFYSYQLDASSITFERASLDGNGDGNGGDDFVARHYVAIPGDANLDGVVDVLNDAFAIVGNLGSTTNIAWADGNFNGDGAVTVLGDAFTLVGNLGRDVRVASDLVVTNTTDLVNGDTGSVAALVANDGGDGISLREAITATNNTSGEETITFDGSVFTGGADSLIRLTQGQLEITDSVTINAATGNNVTITGDANGDDITLPGTFITDVGSSSLYAGGSSALLADNSRVIRSSADYLTLAKVTVTGGRTSDRFSGYYGGAGGGVSFFGGHLSLLSSVVSGNSTTGYLARGGGLFASGGVLELFDSTVSGNQTNGTLGAGGGIAVSESELSLTNSVVTGNSNFGRAAGGSGIFAADGATTLVTGSTINGNRINGDGAMGAGISVRGPLTLINSTVSGNHILGDGDGGGIRAINAESILIINSTIADNSTVGSGGGLYLVNDPADGLSIFNTIIAGNIDSGVAPDLSIPDGLNDSVQVEHSLIGDTTGSGITASSGIGNILNIPAFLGPLADNGGATLTHAPLADSPVINAGSNALAVDADGNPLTEDQRGSGFDRIQVGTVDIGSFESIFDSPVPPIVVSATINEGGVLARPDLLNTLTIVFDEDVAIDPAGLSLFNDSPRGIPVDITEADFSYDSSSSTATWDFTSVALLDAGNYTFQLNPNSVTVGNVTLDSNGDGIRGDGLEIQHYVAIPGDANLDGTVDVLNDAFTLVANLGSTTNVAWANGNFNGDGTVSVLRDAFALVANLGRNVDFVTEVVVNNTSDVVNGDTSSLFDLITNDGGDGISLREAIAASNHTIGPGTITFDDGVFTGGSNSLIRLTQGELGITETLTIDASTGSDVTITGDADGDDLLVSGTFITDVAVSFGGTAGDLLNDNSRVFRFAGGELALFNLTVTGGRTTTDSTDGGGILAASGNVSLTNSVVSGNSTFGRSSDGGGINVDNGDVLLTNSTVSGNSSGGRYADGGGINVGSGDVSLTNSLVSGNTTSEPGAGGGGINIDNGNVSLSNSEVSGNSTDSSNAGGGGINVLTGQVTLDNSSVSGNSTLGSSSHRSPGGGINVYNGDVLLTNSTVSGNSTTGSEGSGGGIHAPNGTASLTNSTVSGNRARSFFNTEGGGISAESVVLINSTVTENSTGGAGGGIGLVDETLTVINSVIAGNRDNVTVSSIRTGPDLFVGSTLTELVVENSLIGDTTGSRITGSTGTRNILNQPALLGPLADNGGPTLTHALLLGSLAIDAGSNALAVDADGNPLTTDQRGTGFDRINFGQVDIGAFELLFDRLATVTSVVVSNTSDDVNGDTTTFSDLIANDGGDGISLREAIVASNTTFGSNTNTIAFDEGVFSGGADSLIRLTQGELLIRETLIIDASAATDLVITGDADGDDILVPGTFITDAAASFDQVFGRPDDLLDDNSRIFNFSGDELALLNLTVTGGRTTVSSQHGGGINVVLGQLALDNSSVSGNSTLGRDSSGGGINVVYGDVSLTNSVVSANTTIGGHADGGGINVGFGNVLLSNSDVSGNSTTATDTNGGGINVEVGQVTLDNSSISGNSTSGTVSDGGGINVENGDVLLTNSTVSGNSTTGFSADGGGIHAPNGTASLTNSTVSGNSVSGSYSDDGGISGGSVVLINSTVTENSTADEVGGVRSLSGSLTVINSIIAGNTDNGTAPDLLVDGGVPELVVENSLIGDTTGSGITASTGTGNILDQPALLGPLADNGGPTLTHALLVGSPAIDAGSNALAVDAEGNALTTDQRGESFNRIFGSTVDIGAFESDFATAPITFAATVQSQSPSLTLAGDHELRDDVFGSDF